MRDLLDVTDDPVAVVAEKTTQALPTGFTSRTASAVVIHMKARNNIHTSASLRSSAPSTGSLLTSQNFFKIFQSNAVLPTKTLVCLRTTMLRS
jgi:hypothetical protein